MPTLTLRLGIALAVLGLASWAIAGFGSPTALIPTFLGAPIAICGAMTLKKPHKAVIFMHVALVLGIILFLGSASRIPKLDNYGSVKSVSIYLAAALSLVLIVAFFKSFLAARKKKIV